MIVLFTATIAFNLSLKIINYNSKNKIICDFLVLQYFAAKVHNDFPLANYNYMQIFDQIPV
jgi:hypothetical protein